MASMPRYIRYPIPSDPAVLSQQVYDAIRTAAPQWVPDDGNLDVWIIQAITTLASDLRELATDVPTDIFRVYGASVVGVPPIDATISTVNSTWTMVDTLGYTIPDGTLVGIRDSSGDLIPFETRGDIIVPAGTAATVAGAVTLYSVNPGADTAGLGSNGALADLIDILDFVASVQLTGGSVGGVDAEDDDAFLDRLARQMRLFSQRPILPQDFAILARTVPGVYRVAIIDGYNPAAGGSFNNERMITFAALDANGADVSTAVKNAVQTLLDGNREVSFVVNAMSANRTTIDVTFAAKAVSGYDTVDVHDRAILALQSYLNAATWGQDETGDPQSWTDKGFVRFSEIGQVLSNVPGLDYWTTLTMRTGANAFATTDITLAAPASLAIAGVVTGTVT